MGRKIKYNAEEKISAVQEYLDGKDSMNSIAQRLGIAFQSFKQWVKNYEALGIDAFKTNQNKHYSQVEKEQAVATYLAGEGSLMEIASYCISHDHNYSETAEKFSVSYQQARKYTVKYEKDGLNALQDNRGKRKPEDSLTEIEKLRAELKLEKAKRQKAENPHKWIGRMNNIQACVKEVVGKKLSTHKCFKVRCSCICRSSVTCKYAALD